jgi:hypothetical protein
MSEANNPLGTDLQTAQNAIRAMLTPQEDTVTEPDALEAEAVEAEAEMPEEAEEYSEEYAQEYDAEAEGDFEAEEDAGEQDDASFDLLSATVEVDGEEITVEELKRGNLRQRDYTRKTQELAEARKQLEANYEEIQRERAQYAQMLPALQERLQQPVEQEPDWDTLYDTDPTMAAKAERQWRKQQEERTAQMQAVEAERQRMMGLEQQRLEQMQAQYFEQQRELLPELIPEWRDNTVASKEAKDIRGFLLKEGFSEQDVNGLTNATLVKLARKAMLYDQGQTRATEAKKKPKTQKAKTLKAGSRSTQPRPKSEQKQALQRVRQTGRVQDAAAAIKTLL